MITKVTTRYFNAGWAGGPLDGIGRMHIPNTWYVRTLHDRSPEKLTDQQRAAIELAIRPIKTLVPASIRRITAIWENVPTYIRTYENRTMQIACMAVLGQMERTIK